MEQPKRVERYGKEIMETPAMDTLRREHCMCLHCARMKTFSYEHSCPIAKEYYEICKKYGNAFIMTRCEHWTGDRFCLPL